MFKDTSDVLNEERIEINDLPNEIIDHDGVDELPEQVSLTDENENTNETQRIISDDYRFSNNSKESQEEKRELREKLYLKGGSYHDVKKTSDGETHEVHHMPADSASNLEREDGPAIKMEKEDHRMTASCGSTREARRYRELQKELIQEEKFMDALQMDIEDLHDKFGDKYDEAIAEMMIYVFVLRQEGRI